MAERRNIGITRRWFTIAATTGLAVPLMSVSVADAAPSSEHLLSVFGDDVQAGASVCVAVLRLERLQSGRRGGRPAQRWGI